MQIRPEETHSARLAMKDTAVAIVDEVRRLLPERKNDIWSSEVYTFEIVVHVHVNH